MNRAFMFLGCCAYLWLAPFIVAQPASPSPEAEAYYRSLSEIDPRVAAAGEPWVVDTASREEVRQFYRSIYFASEGVPMEWTGNLTTGDPGATSAAFKEAVRVRINFFRALAGVPAAVTLNATYSDKAQDAALMMSANNALSHFPPNSWTFYTADGAEAAAASNIALGIAGPDAVTGYMADAGANNNVVGHRRWIVHPQTQEMGTGDVAGDATHLPANAIWVQDGRAFSPRPATRDTFVSYPSPGYTPYQLVFPRWSFSYPGANFTNATVTMSSGGAAVPVTVETKGSGGGAPETSIVWVYNNLNTDESSPHSRPNADTTYTVNVTGVVINGSSQNFEYDVIVFDSDVAGADFVDTAVSGPADPVVGASNDYTVTLPEFIGPFQWRSLQFAPFSTVYGAEGDLQGVVAETTGGYSPRVTGSTAAGNGAYHLAHPSPPTDQFLTLPGTYYLSAGGAGTLSFQSRLGSASESQVARAQISLDDGNSWSDVYSQAGAGSGGEGAYTLRSVDLADFGGQTFQVRFAYTFSTGSFFPQVSEGAGWLIDSITLTGVQAVTAAAPVDVTSGTTFAFTPASAGSYGLQARGLLFTAYPIDWGSVKPVTAENTGQAPAITTQPANTSVAAGGDATFIAAASGTPTPGLQWQISTNNGGAWNNVTNNATYAGATTGTLTINDATEAMDGHQFRVVASNGIGSNATSNAATLSVEPAIPINVTSASPTAGDSTTLSVAEDNNATYQWQFQANGSGAFEDIPGATEASFTLESAQRFHAGMYRVVVTVSGTSTTSGAVNISVAAAPPNSARLLNLSTRGLSLTGDQILIPGFVVSGSGTKRLLIRAVGPTLGGPNYNVPGVLPDPRMSLKRLDFSTPTPTYFDVEANDDWGTSLNAAEITTTMASLGAFPFEDPKEAALLVDLTPGQYTVFADGAANGTGVAIVELYDADTGTPTARLANISNRGFAGVGSEVMIPGFVVSSEGPKTFLVRVVGPTLAGAPYDVPGTMVDPQLQLFRTESNGSSTLLLTQDDWQDNPDSAYTASTASAVSAFALANGSADAAIVVTLEPGSYTVIGSSADGVGTGVVLVEVYVVE